MRLNELLRSMKSLPDLEYAGDEYMRGARRTYEVMLRSNSRITTAFNPISFTDTTTVESFAFTVNIQRYDNCIVLRWNCLNGGEFIRNLVQRVATKVFNIHESDSLQQKRRIDSPFGYAKSTPRRMSISEEHFSWR